MLEKEAKTKWCPMVNQVNHVGECGGNRVGVDDFPFGYYKCIAADCMMWTTEVDGDNQVMEWTGRCGLARHP